MRAKWLLEGNLRDKKANSLPKINPRYMPSQQTTTTFNIIYLIKGNVHKTDKPFLDCLNGFVCKRRPLWFMRQAGRYLPEYRALRTQAFNFIDFCLTPSLAVEATLQPLRRFDLDAAILFADILLVPLALGMDVRFEEGEGPRLSPMQALEQLKWSPNRIMASYEALAQVKDKVNKKQSVIGFCGGPWTVAAYMIEGKGGDFSKAVFWAKNRQDDLAALIELLVEASAQHLVAQIKAGADVVQIFESHAGAIPTELFDRFILRPTQKIVELVQRVDRNIPIIGFPRGAIPENYVRYAKETGVKAVSVDQFIDPVFAAQNLIPHVCVQGNLDPALLVEGGERMKLATVSILKTLPSKHIFNLGHGVPKETPPEHVDQLINLVRNWDETI
ncbi:MAG: uroporphyrinogen decarboxylase [Proteobacteria bacterium]|jgi:uroporphyrinogen decarboxylase|nr:uroporphyrinogen decarboxylase [Alphaproteobacteria bacterium]NCC03626.1 uroporphyrinogen decarboxylase [Pseudomonadota bacterium]